MVGGLSEWVAIAKGRCGHRTARTISQQDGPNHLGSWSNAIPARQMALITSDCVPGSGQLLNFNCALIIIPVLTEVGFPIENATAAVRGPLAPYSPAIPTENATAAVRVLFPSQLHSLLRTRPQK